MAPDIMKCKNEIQQLENEIAQKVAKIHELRRTVTPVPVKNYEFKAMESVTTLRALFGDKTKLFLIHNMGQACRYCTLWADGINAFLPHLESEAAVVLVSKVPPDVQRTFANFRGWSFRLASHGGDGYMREQSVLETQPDMPGMVCYQREGDNIFKLNGAIFGPGDLYCSAWHLFSLAGIGEKEWHPQYAYWRRPLKLEDGGLRILE
jgi:predicted dithiol-disulfide oxidoreductase (DUF899 family)